MRSLRSWLLLWLVSTLVGVYFTVQWVCSPAAAGTVTWRRSLSVNLTSYYIWGLFVPTIVWLGRRMPFDEQRWRTSLAGHVPASVVITSFITVLSDVILLYVLRTSSRPLGDVIVWSFSMNFQSMLPTYWMILLASVAFDFYVQMRDRELQASQLQASLSDARLAALRMQLRPHFLFNTLNSISSLIYEDTRAADAMVSRLAAFLRRTIDWDTRQLVPVREELDFIQRYLEIEQVRFEDRLRVQYDVDADALEALIPPMILQPIVENAIHHAIAPRPHGGRVTVAACAAGDRLLLRVEDDGPGLTNGTSSPRVGLQNTRARLEQLYGSGFSLAVQPAARGGVAVAISIPLRAASHARENETWD